MQHLRAGLLHRAIQIGYPESRTRRGFNDGASNPSGTCRRTPNILKLDGARKDNLAQWNRVAWICPLEPGYKLSPDLGQRSYTSEDRRDMASLGVLRSA